MGESVPALGHDWGDLFGDDVAPTCTTAGGKNHTCKRCGVTELDNSVAALGHEWGGWSTLAPTCTEQGYDWRTCSRCDELEKTNFVAAPGHDWGDPFDYVAPTCTTAGGYHHRCQRDGCGMTELDNSVAALGHSWSADYHCIRGDAELPAIAYVKADGTAGSHQAIPITGTSEDDVVLGFENGDTWYYLSGDFNLHSLRLTDRTANVILTAGCNIRFFGGTTIENGSLNIYTQSSTGKLNSFIIAHDDVHIHGGYVMANDNGLSAGGDITLGWTNTDDLIFAHSYSAGGTITVAEGKVMKTNSIISTIFYGDGTPINAADITGKWLEPKTDVLCYVGEDGAAHFLNDGNYTVLTNSTDLSAYNSSSGAAERWFVVKDADVAFEKLDICGTTHLVLLDDASLTFNCANDYPIYHAGTLNIYGGLKGNGRLTVSSGDYHTAICVKPFNAPTSIPGYLNIYGGQVSATSASGIGIQAGSGATLSWTRPANSIRASSFGGIVNLAKTFVDNDGTLHTSDNVGTLAGKTLMGVDVLQNNAANDIAALNGKETRVALAGRKLWKDGDWNTLCLPFAMTAEQVSAQLAPEKLMTLSSSAFAEGNLTLNFADATTIEAGKPYIIKWSKPDGYTVNGGFDITDPVFRDVTVSTTTANVETDYVNFLGSHSPVSLSDNDKTVLYLGADNELCYPSDDMTIGSCRAYFQLTGATNVKGFSLNFGEEETTTGIINSQLSIINSSEAGAWYTLDGRKVANGQRPTAKGLYINNGRKVVIK